MDVRKQRWLIAIMGTILQLCLGTVYAWSFFQKPLVEAYRWSNAQVALVFSLAICFLGLAAAWGGTQLPKYGPRRLAMLGGALFGAGFLVAALALHVRNLPLLYIGYGVIGGIGLGLGYVTPVATVSKWFPDKKGLVTGMVIMGFGFGALLMSKVIAPLLLAMTDNNMVMVFGWMGGLLAPVALIAALFMKNPPAEFTPAGYMPKTMPDGAVGDGNHGFENGAACLCSSRFAVMWLVFFFNIVAGIGIIGFQSPLVQELFRRQNPDLTTATLATYGATLIAISSIFNGVGRLFWGGLSDRIGRARTFRIMLASQVVVFVILTRVTNPWLFGGLVCYVLFCYGGGFGTMPSFVLDAFGSHYMAVVYGAILTAWSIAGVAGPQLLAYLKDRYPQEAAVYSFTACALLLGVGFILSLALANRYHTRSVA